eukprot:CAMPEP_0203748666 /NCGR_PEP_ID=MMETSP0098-20131031/3492_1 /ASSEMBLY_ACC=CAM_ASM_000208 /TAXON_ID=96639 /ORGANISM=" , Strain NY0313808BC1" /LENGTH=163 /DNA_ID=CAMNT_0050637499 /DNA_START=765 /DNA_END=1256 /DNA_ORIENTATION=+
MQTIPEMQGIRHEGKSRVPPLAAAVVEYRVMKAAKSTVYTVYRLNVASPSNKSIHRWAMWRRYSEFAMLHKSLVATYGWRMDHIRLPPKKYFNNLDSKFVGRRMEGLDNYLCQVLTISGVSLNENIRAFLGYDIARNPSLAKDLLMRYATPNEPGRGLLRQVR